MAPSAKTGRSFRPAVAAREIHAPNGWEDVLRAASTEEPSEPDRRWANTATSAVPPAGSGLPRRPERAHHVV
jgi:hypothetical protein